MAVMKLWIDRSRQKRVAQLTKMILKKILNFEQWKRQAKINLGLRKRVNLPKKMKQRHLLAKRERHLQRLRQVSQKGRAAKKMNRKSRLIRQRRQIKGYLLNQVVLRLLSRLTNPKMSRRPKKNCRRKKNQPSPSPLKVSVVSTFCYV
eukprot:Gregarina_sp_Poly_1__7822@NODE_442_length_8345_cov_11_503503_g360_i0_p6_GENE_NODE_442_length_8345_cov_11_503503_g360_i0NODE_442_length_8345_cov_11_503503_g360_i0_p6_ORF_typecomplete_len148_score21_99Cucumo_2B/PF03263_13/5_7e02Cucumo_2B/PF03263_13/12Cucumo_2B/PF03263_13/14_NODE_442_length_8345_cov_11_503503_g360_i063716814